MTTSNLVLIFDTETTGLLSKNDGIEGQPFIIQFSFVIFDMGTFEIKKKFNEYIKIEPSIEIKPIITEITGITREICDNKGIPIENAIMEFYDAYISCRFLVAHNISFDKKMILIELKRNIHKIYPVNPNILSLFNDVFNYMNGIEEYCTMNFGKNICNIMLEKKNVPKVTNVFTNQPIIQKNVNTETKTNQFKKNPKLSELHEFLFGFCPLNLHDSLVDSIVCLKCFLKMRFNSDIVL